ncbi:MAG: hypothetical protein WCO35_01335 [Candidatus Nomurabacteria bacterium]
MCLPRIHIERLENTSEFKEVILNDPAECYKDFNPDLTKPWSKGMCILISNTEYSYVFVVLIRGVQTYFAHIPKYKFAKFGSDCVFLAKEVDRELMKNKQSPINFFHKKAS